jgi:hypothetical protein
MKAYGGVHMLLHNFLTLAQIEASGQLHALASFILGEGVTGTH